MGNYQTYHYTTSKGNKRKKEEPDDDPDDEVPAVEAELKTRLRAVDVDFHIEENAKDHHTDKFECIYKREDTGFGSEPEAVLRRGQTFVATIEFDRNYSLQYDDMQIMLTNGGKLAKKYKSTSARFEIDESGKSEYKPDEWGGKLLKKNGKFIKIEIHIACNCAIGYWKFCVLTKSKVKGDLKIFQFTSEDKLTILFNAWSKDDTVYMKDVALLKEYILNEHTAVFRGNGYHPKGKAWNLGQFEDGILEIVLYLLMKCLKRNQRHKLSDPVWVVRMIAAFVNSNDADKGVLVGNWSGDYKGGANPGSWSGSVKLLKKYWENKTSVKYGQCWVFSGVTTTVCRLLGIATTCVTNYSSAHDSDNNNVIEKYFKVDDDGDIVTDRGSDSIWNYHVWNHVYLKRDDLDIGGKYDGWQAIDATPQERSEGIFTCGPAPLAAIKTGNVSLQYDIGFVFAEVNADVIQLLREQNRTKKLKMKTAAVGKSISTKTPDGKKFNPGIFDTQRDDVTDWYKFEEGSAEARQSVLLACGESEYYKGDSELDDVEFKLLHAVKLPYGKSVEVKLTALNKTTEDRKNLKVVRFRFLAMKYTGEEGKKIKVDVQKVDDWLEPGKKQTYTTTLEPKEYLGYIDESYSMTIQVFAIVAETNTRPRQDCVKCHEVTFEEPNLTISMPATAKVGEEFEACFEFENPLEEELVNCTAGYEGRGFKYVTEKKQDNVPALGKGKGKFILKGLKKGEFTLTFNFSSKQLQNISGTGEVEIV